MITMTNELIEVVQQAWGDGIVNISSAHRTDRDYGEVARDHVDTLYAYGLTSVLFKPTLAAEQQFRSTFDDALSYFVASNGACLQRRE